MLRVPTNLMKYAYFELNVLKEVEPGAGVCVNIILLFAKFSHQDRKLELQVINPWAGKKDVWI